MINNWEILKGIITFDNPGDFYIIQIIKRRKDNPDLDKTSVILKEKYATSQKYLESRLPEWMEYAKTNNARIYINPNRRDMTKMGIRMISALSEYVLTNQYNVFPDIFAKTVGKFSDEKIKRWIIDIDDVDEVPVPLLALIKELHGKNTRIERNILAIVPTNSGFCVITEPFDMKKFKNRVSEIIGNAEIPTVFKNSPVLLFKP